MQHFKLVSFLFFATLISFNTTAKAMIANCQSYTGEWSGNCIHELNGKKFILDQNLLINVSTNCNDLQINNDQIDSLGATTKNFKSSNSVGTPTDVTETRSLRISSINGVPYYSLVVNQLVVPEQVFSSRHETFQKFITLTSDSIPSNSQTIHYTENSSWTTIFDGDIQSVPTPRQQIETLTCVLNKK